MSNFIDLIPWPHLVGLIIELRSFEEFEHCRWQTYIWKREDSTNEISDTSQLKYGKKLDLKLKSFLLEHQVAHSIKRCF